MSKIINVSTLYKLLPYPDDAIEAEFYGKVLDAIEACSSVDDRDKIIERLEEEIDKADDKWQFYHAFTSPRAQYYDGIMDGCAMAIEFLQGGGSDE